MKPSELVAIAIVRDWIGASGSIGSLGEGDNADFEIIYSDGRTALGEIKADTNEATKSQWEAINKLPGNQAHPITVGLGAWSFQITNTALIKDLVANADALITELKKSGIYEWTKESGNGQSTLDKNLIGLSVEVALHHSGINSDYLWIQPMEDFHAWPGIPLDSNCAIPWIAEIFKVKEWQKSWERLRVPTNDEGHVFIWIDSDSPHQLKQRARFHPTVPPTQNPELIDGVTHLWIGVSSNFNGNAVAWLYTVNSGWQKVISPSNIEY